MSITEGLRACDEILGLQGLGNMSVQHQTPKTSNNNIQVLREAITCRPELIFQCDSDCWKVRGEQNPMEIPELDVEIVSKNKNLIPHP
jgi:hypothetical protein